MSYLACWSEAAISCLCISFQTQTVLQHASCFIRTSENERKLVRRKDISCVISSEVASSRSVSIESPGLSYKGKQRIMLGCGHNTPMNHAMSICTLFFSSSPNTSFMMALSSNGRTFHANKGCSELVIALSRSYSNV